MLNYQKNNNAEMHTTKDGTKIKITDMTASHLKNTISHIERKSKSGVLVQYADDGENGPYYDEYVCFGEEALSKLNYSAYRDELARRVKSNNVNNFRRMPVTERPGRLAAYTVLHHFAKG